MTGEEVGVKKTKTEDEKQNEKEEQEIEKKYGKEDEEDEEDKNKDTEKSLEHEEELTGSNTHHVTSCKKSGDVTTESKVLSKVDDDVTVV